MKVYDDRSLNWRSLARDGRVGLNRDATLQRYGTDFIASMARLAT